MAARVRARVVGVVVAMMIAVMSAGALAAPAQAADYQRYLDLPLTNRFADKGPGGINAALPTDLPTLTRLIGQARSSGVDPHRYAALLMQFRLAQATSQAAIDLAAWNPQRGFVATRSNMIKSYRLYEDLQISHKNLQWAGMAGLVGADFGGGIADIVMMRDIYAIQGLQPLAAQIIEATTTVAGKGFIGIFPKGLQTLAYSADKITPADLDWFTKRILVMQKAIFTDLMPLHMAYVCNGIAGIDEMYNAGIIDSSVRAAWSDIDSKDAARVATGNETLLRREQYSVVGEPFNEVRNYRKADGVGEALTYAMTLAGSPSVAGVPALRDFIPFVYTGKLADGRTIEVHTPIANWDWSVFDQRWKYVTTELLPRYQVQVNHHWNDLVATMKVPYETQFESHRPIWNLHKILADAASHTSVTVR